MLPDVGHTPAGRGARGRRRGDLPSSPAASPLAEERLGLVGDQPRERQGRGRGGRGGVADVDRGGRPARRGSRRPGSRRRPTAWARMPAGPRTKSAARSSGTRRRASATKARFDAACRSSRSPARQWRATSRRVPGQASVSRRSAARRCREPVGVAGADDQRRRPEQHRAVGAAGQMGAEERQLGIGHRVDVRRARAGALGAQPQVAAAERDDPRRRRRRPAARARRSAQAPAQTIAARAPGRRRARGGRLRRRRRGLDRCTAQPVMTDAARASRGRRRRRAATRGEVDDARVRRVQRRRSRRRAARSRAARRRRGGAGPRRRWRPAAFELVEAASSPSLGGDDQLAGPRAPRCRARRSTRRARAPRRRRAAPSASPGS